MRLRHFTTVFLFVAAIALSPRASGAGTPPPTDAASVLFNTLIPRCEISLEPEAVQSLRTQPREYVKATLRVGTNVFRDVGVKLKGSRGSFRPVDDRPALTINMDKFVQGQSFHGLNKFHLNNSAQDPSLMNEIIASELFMAAGVPTARATHARVQLDGRDLGFYVLKEGYNKRFLKRHFKDTNGNLYDGGFLMDVDENLEKDSGDGPDNWSDLVALWDAANEPDLAKRKTRLEAVLDLDRFMTFTALELLTGHWDGYTQNRNNYRLYHNPETEKFVFIPHGMDQMFRDVNYQITPGVSESGRGRGRGGFRRNGMVAMRVFEVTDFQRQYLDRMGQLLEKEFTAEWLGAQVNRIEARVRSQLGTTDPQFVSYLSAHARNLRRQLADRVRSAKAQHAALMKHYRAPER
jgi:spore coat protein H